MLSIKEFQGSNLERQTGCCYLGFRGFIPDSQKNYEKKLPAEIKLPAVVPRTFPSAPLPVHHGPVFVTFNATQSELMRILSSELQVKNKLVSSFYGLYLRIVSYYLETITARFKIHTR
jgi:hypothetical protein